MLMVDAAARHVDLGFYVVAVAWSGSSCAAARMLSPLLSFPTSRGGLLRITIRDLWVRNLITSARIASVLAVIVVGLLSLVTLVDYALLFGAAFRQSIAPALLLIPAGLVFLSASMEFFRRVCVGLGGPTPFCSRRP